MTAGDLVVGAGTLLLAAFTGWLAHRTSADVALGEEQIAVARESIEAQERGRRRARQEDAAVDLDRCVLDAGRNIPTGEVVRADAADPIDSAYQSIREGWGRTRAYLQREDAIVTAYNVLEFLLDLTANDCTSRRDEMQNFYVLSTALDDLRDALAAFVAGEPAPKPRLPHPGELLSLTYVDGEEKGLDGINRWRAY